jgi:hypothetical protein
MRLIPASLLFYSLGYAEVLHPGSGVIAHIADGGGMQTEVTITNLDDKDNCFSVAFLDDNGNPVSLVTSAGFVNRLDGALAAHASRSVRTTGAASSVTQGWVSLVASGNVGASASFRVSAPPWKGSEAVVPADTWRNNRFSLAFDHTDSGVIGLAMVNPLPDPVAVTLLFRGEDGNVILSDTVSMKPRAHRAIVTTSSYPATAGKRGTIEISTTGLYMSVVALRFGPSAISAVVPLVSNQWAAFDNTGWGCWDY